MKFAQWNSDHRYADHLAPGWLPEGAIVKFGKFNKDTGTVVGGNAYRSLIEYHPAGGGWTREWFDNANLKIAE